MHKNFKKVLGILNMISKLNTYKSLMIYRAFLMIYRAFLIPLS